jgi:hypothetical protein
MVKTAGRALVAGALFALSVAPAHSIITFTQLDQNTFTVSHRVKGFGSRGKATRMVYTKAASLCIAAGYSHYQVVDQESQASQQYEAANATVVLRFFNEDGQDRVSCKSGSDPEYVAEARAKLKEMGYRPPEVVQSGNETSASGAGGGEASATCSQGCTIEQIAAMARAGLSDEKIRAACEADAGRDSGKSMD